MKTLNKLPLLLAFTLITTEAPYVNAAVTPGNGTIDITANVSTISNTPESAVGQALFDLCPKIQAIVDGEGIISADTQNLLDVCTALNTMDQSLTGQAYKQLSARSITALVCSMGVPSG